MSASGFDARIERSMLPVPASTVSTVSGAVTYASALPRGTGFHRYLGVRLSSTVFIVRGYALGSSSKRSAWFDVGAALVRVPCSPRYQVVAVVLGNGNDGPVVENDSMGVPLPPTSKSTRTFGSVSYARSADS